MVQSKKIVFYKVRNFSAKLNATIEFIRQNVKPLGKAILYIMGPLAIVNGILFSQYINFMFGSMSQTEPVDVQNPFGFIFSSSYIGFIILSTLAGMLNLAIIFNFMKIYNAKYPEPITVTEVLNTSWRDILPLFLLVVITGIFIFAGFFALVIPGFYLMIVMSLAFPALMFERKGIFESIGRSFKLIRGKWWSTFGLLFVAYIIANAVTMLFVIPFYILYFVSIFTMIEETGVNADISSWWFQGGMTLSVILMVLGSFLAYAIPMIALNFQYFNLVERQESVGLMSEIEQIDTDSNTIDS